MDHQTINTYDNAAERIAALHTTLIPVRIYQLVDQFFIQDGTCADIGCGIGRDSAWLSSQGYGVTGFDASDGMLEQAKVRYPNIRFISGSLPLLEQQADCAFTNVLCSAVIMHLGADQIGSAVANLMRIIAMDGVIILTFRGTRNHDQRESGKLYTPIEAEELISLFIQAGAKLLHHENDLEAGRDLEWTNLVFRKSPRPAA
jgi:ubiquinone/menaquinone biosynthesis C-methylase UbiE